MALNEALLKLLACPQCHSPVAHSKENWLVCSECSRKYPIVNEIPVMLVEEGTKYIGTTIDDLPNPNDI